MDHYRPSYIQQLGPLPTIDPPLLDAADSQPVPTLQHPKKRVLNTPGNWAVVILALMSAAATICGAYPDSCPTSANLTLALGSLAGMTIIALHEHRSEPEETTWTARCGQVGRVLAWMGKRILRFLPVRWLARDDIWFWVAWLIIFPATTVAVFWWSYGQHSALVSIAREAISTAKGSIATAEGSIATANEAICNSVTANSVANNCTNMLTQCATRLRQEIKARGQETEAYRIIDGLVTANRDFTVALMKRVACILPKEEVIGLWKELQSIHNLAADEMGVAFPGLSEARIRQEL